MRGRTLSALRELLQHVDEAAAGNDADAVASVAYVAARSVEIDETELNAARRRALLVLTSGGDPHRGLEVDGRAVGTLAADLDSPRRRAQMEEVLDEVARHAGGLPHVTAAVEELRADADVAWRWVAVALLADELDATTDA